ncbi:MAG: hypothetical protein HOK57_12985 [Planctomycetaceae bacterium]|jgi:hypothetical protein|nr:hypothetical protein [Planctomycetaceae bacterium]MBT6460711.1 hypothetical protein [Planctomycetaceae bacterium]
MDTKPNNTADGSSNEPQQLRRATWSLVLVVIAWGAILAVGAFLSWDRIELASEPAQIEDLISTPKRVMKLVITLGTVLLFAGGWSLALFARQRRLRKEETTQSN